MGWTGSDQIWGMVKVIILGTELLGIVINKIGKKIRKKLLITREQRTENREQRTENREQSKQNIITGKIKTSKIYNKIKNFQNLLIHSII